MSEPKETTGTGARPGQQPTPRKPLSLSLNKTVDAGHVQQKFSHGRTKTVEVVKKRPRTLAGQEAERPAPVAPPPQRPQTVPNRPPRQTAETSRTETRPAPTRTLSDGEMAARARALAAAQARMAEERAREQVAPTPAVASTQAPQEDSRSQSAGTAEVAATAPETAATLSDARPAQADGSATAAVESRSAPSDGAAEPAAAPAKAEVATSAPGQTTAAAPQAGAQPPSAGAPAAPAAPAAATHQPYRPSLGGPSERERMTVPRAAAASPSSMPSSSEPLFKPFSGMIRPQIVTRTDRPSPKPPAAVEAPKPQTVDNTRRAQRSGSAAELGDDDVGRGKKRGAAKGAPVRATVKGPELKERGKLTINNAFNEQQRERSLASLKRKRERERLKAMGIPQAREKIVREVIIPEAITIQELSNRMTERAVDIIKFLMKEGAMHKINDVIDADTAELIVQDFGHTPKRVSEADVEEGFIGASDHDDHLEPRAPVVTIMGHVDHGKTSLLDAIRSADVAAGEAGGITQHIGAYQVTTPGGNPITFIDTPGHEAFTAMRARGAKVTDIVVLVVAADDGVMPQTVEAISHAKAAGVPIIVAINKMDKPGADPTRVRTELLQHEIVVESMSGETLDVPVSALQRTGLDQLLEAISLQAELLDLKANPNRTAEGFVIEAKLERGRGPVGTLLVQRGTLKVGDIVVAGAAWGRVRALIDEHGGSVRTAGPSVPVEVLGFDSAPDAGDQFAVVENEARAREITAYRDRKRREALGQAGTARTLEQMMQQLKEAGRKEFPLVVKGDVQGSVEAIMGALKKLSTDEVEARIIHSGVGGITESDVALANASKAVILGFNVRTNMQAKQAAERDGVEIRYYNIIYDLVDDVKGVMSGMLAPTIRENFLGNATILQVFNISKVGKVAGCRVTEGKVERGAKVRLIRDHVVIHEGTLSILKRFKDDVKDVPAGQECGMQFANYQDIREGDTIECFQIETIARTL